MESGHAAGPPPVPFVLCVGVTGHRADVLPKGGISVLRDRVRDVLRQIEESGRALLAAERDSFASLDLQLRFVSPVADGACARSGRELLFGANPLAILGAERGDG